MDAVYWLQVVCVALTVAEYASQIHKTFKTKHVEDLSWGYWICKNSINVLQIAILIISGNPLKVFLSQTIGFFGCLLIFAMMIKYHYQTKGENK